VDSFLEPLRSFIARDYEQRTGHRLNDPHDNSNNNNSGNNSGSNSGNSTSGSGVGNGEDSSSSNGNNNGGEPSSPASGGGYFMGPPDGVNDLALVRTSDRQRTEKVKELNKFIYMGVDSHALQLKKIP